MFYLRCNIPSAIMNWKQEWILTDWYYIWLSQNWKTWTFLRVWFFRFLIVLYAKYSCYSLWVDTIPTCSLINLHNLVTSAYFRKLSLHLPDIGVLSRWLTHTTVAPNVIMAAITFSIFVDISLRADVILCQRISLPRLENRKSYFGIVERL